MSAGRPARYVEPDRELCAPWGPTGRSGHGDAATYAAHLAEGSDDPAARAEHLRRCGPCAAVTRELRGDPVVGPDLELRLLRAFRDWRDT